MSRNQKKRLTGRWVVIGFLSLIGVTVLAAVLGFFRAKDPRGEILAMAAVDGESAALFREISRKRGYIHLTRIFADDSQPVKITLFGIPKGSEPRVIEGLIVADVFEARGYPTLQAFEVDDLAFRYWGPEPARSLADEQPATSFELELDGRPVIVTAYAGAPGELLVVDALEGEELLRVPLEGLEAPLKIAPLNRPEPGVKIVSGDSERSLRLKDGEPYEGEYKEERDCRVDDGALVFGEERFPAKVAPDEIFGRFEGGCASHDGRVLRIIGPGGERSIALESEAPLLSFRPAHLSGRSLFLAMGGEVAIVDLDAESFKKEIDGLKLSPR